MKRLLLLAGLFVCSVCHAGTGYYVTFVNDTDRTIVLEFSHASGWYPKDFASGHTLLAHQKIELYTEDVAKGAGVAGVRVASGPYEGSVIEVWQSIRGEEMPPYRSTQGIRDVESRFLRQLHSDTVLRHFVGTNNPDILTHIEVQEQGTFNTVYAIVTFPRYSAVASCRRFKVVGDTASAFCYSSKRPAQHRYTELNLATCKGRYGPNFDVANISGELTCAPPGAPIKPAGR